MALTNTIVSVSKIIRGLINDKIKTDGRDSWVFETDNIFTISEPNIDSTTIKVFKNGTIISVNDWTYSSDNNQVAIVFVSSGQSLVTNDVILITYSYYEKFSQIEIQGFIESSLSYFAQYKYKKIFETDINSNIVSVNDIDPTINELYFIAMITSIVIDPQNTKIDIPDLKMSPNRNLSDQDQIKEAFANFKKYIGDVSFSEDNL